MDDKKSFLGHFKFVFAILVVVCVTAWAARWKTGVGPALIGAFASLALYFMSQKSLKIYAFTIWVFAFVSFAMVYPGALMTWHGFDLKNTITPLIQIIMFGMGVHLSLGDFARVIRVPWPVCIGFFSQFIVMPLVSFTLAKVFGFEPAIAAGVVLIGCCPSGVASNVMTYLAQGDVAVAVTITSCSTLVSPVLTPWLMMHLAGKGVTVKFLPMMFDIINMIIVPIVVGLIANKMLYSRHKLFRNAGVLALVGAVGVSLALCVAFLAPTALFTVWGACFPKSGLVIGLMLISLAALAKLVIAVWLKGPENWMDRVLPTVSMVAICTIIAVITARSRDDLLRVGALLIVSMMIQNATGYLMGYWLARAARLKESACRAVAFEVGMQNAGMASALAMNVLNSAQAALAPAIFGPWMNVSGSILATWWRRKPVPVPTKDAP